MFKKIFFGGVIAVIAAIALLFSWSAIQQNIMRGVINEPWAVSAQTNPNGKIIIVEFLDYSCPQCHRFHPILNGATKNNQNTNIIIRPIGLLGEDSTKMARLVIAAGFQNKAMQLHKKIMSMATPPTIDIIFDSAKHLGLNMDQLKTDSESDASMKILKINEAVFRLTKMGGVPALLINGQNYIPDPMPNATTLKTIIYKDIK
jgi:protein-disulfide isomerase